LPLTLGHAEAQRAMFLLLLHSRRHQVQNQGQRMSGIDVHVRIFVDDTIAIAVWTSFDTRAP
jgi:hypothetical protein